MAAATYLSASPDYNIADVLQVHQFPLWNQITIQLAQLALFSDE